MSRLGSIATIGSFSEFYKKPKPISVTITPNVSSLYEGDSVKFDVVTANVPDNTTLYYSISNVSGNLANTFADNNFTGSFVVNSNAGSITKATSAEDNNSTDEIFVFQVRRDSATGTVLQTTANIKVVDLTAYNAANAVYNNLTVSFNIGAGGAGANGKIYDNVGWGSQSGVYGSMGGNTTATFQGTTIYGNGGYSGSYYNSSYILSGGAGGSYSGGDGGAVGGAGSTCYGNISAGNGAGGAIGGNAGPTPSGGTTLNGTLIAYGAKGANWTTDVSGLKTFLSSKGASNFNGTANGRPATGTAGLGAGGGGADYVGADYPTAQGGGYNNVMIGTNGGEFGGGAGASSGYTTYAALKWLGVIEPSGGNGGIAISHASVTGGTGFYSTTPGANTYTLPSDTTSVKIWVTGGGGGASSFGRGTTANDGCGAGGAGGTAYKTWTRTAPTKPSL